MQARLRYDCLMKKKIPLVVIILLLLIIAVLAGVMLGQRHGSPASQGKTDSQTATDNTVTATSRPDLKALVSYTLPDGWKEGSCAGNDKVYIVPRGETLKCDGNPILGISLAVDPQSTNDCQQLNTGQGVRKHTCKSLFIDGHKSLQSLTEYPATSQYRTNTTFSDYFIDTGKGVAKLEYTYTTVNNYQTDFDRFANSIKVQN
jgi:hypothetical protein